MLKMIEKKIYLNKTENNMYIERNLEKNVII